MDIKKFAVSETARMVLKDGKGDAIEEAGKQSAIVFYGPGSKQFARALTAQNNRTVARLSKNGGTDQTPEEKAENDVKFLVDCTHSFENIDYDKLEGAGLYKAVYMDRSIGFIADQSSAFLGNWSNFTKG